MPNKFQIDGMGIFEIPITDDDFKGALEFAAIGYDSLEIPLRKIKNKENFILRLHSAVPGKIAIINRCKNDIDLDL